MNEINRKTGVIILAAGESKRFGKPKQLLEFQEKTLLKRITETALETENKTIVVLGANANKIIGEVKDLTVEIVVNKYWQNGMSSSIKTGLEKLLEIQAGLENVILLLCDQPFVNKETILNLIEIQTKTQKSIVACKYENTIGVPALFRREMFDRLLSLKGESGAKNLILENSKNLATISAPEAAFDIDTTEDFEALKKISF